MTVRDIRVERLEQRSNLSPKKKCEILRFCGIVFSLTKETLACLNQVQQ